MVFEKWGLEFSGLFTSPIYLAALPGIYVAWAQKESEWSLLTVGETEDCLAAAVTYHNRAAWDRNQAWAVRYAATYIPNSSADDRKAIVERIRSEAEAGNNKP